MLHFTSVPYVRYLTSGTLRQVPYIRYLTSGTLQYTLLVVQYMLGIEKSKVMELECVYCVP